MFNWGVFGLIIIITCVTAFVVYFKEEDWKSVMIFVAGIVISLLGGFLISSPTQDIPTTGNEVESKEQGSNLDGSISSKEPENEDINPTNHEYISLFDLTPHTTGTFKLSIEEHKKDNVGNIYEKSFRAYMGISDGGQSYTYDVGKLYNVLTGVASIPEGRESSTYTGYLKIYGDDILLWSKTDFDASTKPTDISVDITGVTDLKIEMAADGNMGSNGLNILFSDIILQQIKDVSILQDEININDVIQQAEDIFLSNGDYESALQIIKEAQQIYPDNYNLYEKEVFYKQYIPVSLYDINPYLKGSHSFYLEYNKKDNMGNIYEKSFRAYMGVSDGGQSHTYDIGGIYNVITGIASIPEGRESSKSTGYLKIYGDDVLLWSKTDFDASTKPIDISVDITGVTDLKIEMAADGNMGSNGLSILFSDIHLQRQK